MNLAKNKTALPCFDSPSPKKMAKAASTGGFLAMPMDLKKTFTVMPGSMKFH